MTESIDRINQVGANREDQKAKKEKQTRLAIRAFEAVSKPFAAGVETARAILLQTLEEAGFSEEEKELGVREHLNGYIDFNLKLTKVSEGDLALIAFINVAGDNVIHASSSGASDTVVSQSGIKHTAHYLEAASRLNSVLDVAKADEGGTGINLSGDSDAEIFSKFILYHFANAIEGKFN